jgi:hypothetical protein
MNIEEGIPTTIAANLPCLDEKDPDNVQRCDLGLIVTITEQGPPGQFTTVKLHFLPYEGLDSTLRLMGEDTYSFIEKALRKQMASRAVALNLPPVQGEDADHLNENSSAISTQTATQGAQPPAVPSEITLPASSGSAGTPATAARAEESFLAAVYPAAMPVQEPASGPAPDAGTLTQDTARQVQPDSFAPPAPEPLFFPEPTPLPAFEPLAAALPVPSPPVVQPGSDLLSGAQTPAESAAAVCPACSQPVNPSFPFCLYCGKNF